MLRQFSAPNLSLPRTASSDSLVVKGTCSDRTCVKQLRIYHARHQPSLGFPGATNVGHESSESGSTLDGFGSRDLQVFAEAKHSIQLRYLMLFFHSISCSPRTIFGYWKDFLSVTSKASVFSGAIFRHLLSNQPMGPSRLPRSSLSSTEVGFSLLK